MKILSAIFRGIRGVFVTVLGTLNWLLQALLQMLTLSAIVGVLICLIVYIKIKPDLDYCRETAYDKLAQMNRLDFRMNSDTEIYDRNGKLVGLINAGHYEYAPIDEISLNIQNAYIAQEDRRFKSHTGVDWIATFRAGLALVKHSGSITQGGSTITQQVVKNTYLTQEQTFSRKIIEILLAPEIEKEYSKADIMEFYCNTNFYGNHCYGVQSASRYYFDKDASELEPYEAALLAGLSNSPSAYNPIKHPEAALEKRNDVLKSMYEVGFLTEEEYEANIGQRLIVAQAEGEGTNENYQSSYALHCAALEMMKMEDFAFQYIYENKADYDAYTERYQALYNEKMNDLRSGGYRIYTSLDSNLQDTLQKSLDETLASYTELQDNGKFALQGAGVIVDNQSNYVVAVVGGRGEDDAFNRAYLSARQPGSTIKPLLDYGPAFDTGEYYPSRQVDDHKWEDGPSNSSNKYHGKITVREALNRSLNTVAWQVLDDIGVNFGLSYLGEMAFQRLTYVDNDVPSLSIGGFTNGVRVVDMAKGYSTLANNGVYNDRTCILKIEHEQQGEITKNMLPHAKQIYQEDSVFMLTDILKGTLTEPYGTGYGLALANDMPAAGKTGTTNSSKDTWFCGYTRYYTTAVWVGYDIPRAMYGVYGSTYAGKIWKQVMDEIHTGLEPWDWEQPETVEERQDEDNGITDYFSTITEIRAQQSLHDKEQRQLEDSLETQIETFENKTIETVEDTYWVKEQYRNMVSQINLMDEGETRGEFLERVTVKYEEFDAIISDMRETISLYEQQKMKERTASQKKAAEAAEIRRKELEVQTKKNTFLNALAEVENLQYQAPNAQSLIQDAINKLSLVNSYSEASSYKQRLDAAISRVSTLPTATEWERQQDEKAAAEAAAQEALQSQISGQQQQLESSLRREQQNWGGAVGPGAEVHK